MNNSLSAKPQNTYAGVGIQPQHLNDDKLGRILDQLEEVGLTQLYVEIALAGASQYQVETKSLHLDSSSMSVHGEYLGRSTPASEAMPAIAITHGYWRDHRPDLKQFMVDLRTAHGGETALRVLK